MLHRISMAIEPNWYHLCNLPITKLLRIDWLNIQGRIDGFSVGLEFVFLYSHPLITIKNAFLNAEAVCQV